ncbi:MAG: MarR family transcriptional regulator [Candidatus Krumholzibacteria bacterium]|nr:MarR family transcriptional regulator [Candidatus Krumholzibacteria bacterium]
MSDQFENRFPESAAIRGEQRQIARQEFAMRKRILELLSGGSKTVPEVAHALGLKPHEAMWWMMGYVRYGYVRPTGEVTDEGYDRYEIAEGK